MAHVIGRDKWASTPDRWQGQLQCGAFGSNSCLIF
ncbi:MAG: cupin domain-containing protein, partial [Mesorhizobium sp.]